MVLTALDFADVALVASVDGTAGSSNSGKGESRGNEKSDFGEHLE